MSTNESFNPDNPNTWPMKDGKPDWRAIEDAHGSWKTSVARAVYSTWNPDLPPEMAARIKNTRVKVGDVGGYRGYHKTYDTGS